MRITEHAAQIIDGAKAREPICIQQPPPCGRDQDQPPDAAFHCPLESFLIRE
jgi:hypothetical protein